MVHVTIHVRVDHYSSFSKDEVPIKGISIAKHKLVLSFVEDVRLVNISLVQV